MDMELLRAEVHDLKAQLKNLNKRLSQLAIVSEQVDKGAQMVLARNWIELARRGEILRFSDVGFRNYSQWEEDGILHYIFSLIGSERKSVEFCAGNGWECMSTNLILNHGWYSLLVDGNSDLVQMGTEFYAQHPSTKFAGPKFLNRMINRETVNELLREAGFTGEIDLLTIDMDGVDYWIWDAITEISPRVVCAEVAAHLGELSITVPYHPEFRAKWINLENETSQKGDGERKGAIYNLAVYGGASLPAFTKLAHRKGYRLIGVNGIGNNAFYMRNDVGQEYFPEKDWRDCFNRNHDAEGRKRIMEVLLRYEWIEV